MLKAQIEGKITVSKKNLSIAIFQYDLPLQSYSRDLAVKLREMGAKVEFFGFRLGDRDFVSQDECKLLEIPFHNLVSQQEEIQTQKNPLRHTWKKLAWRWRRFQAKRLFGSNLNYMNRSVLLQSIQIMKRGQYDLLIGIEKQGLIWAGMMSKVFKVPYFYYSLELYLEDNEMMVFLRHFREPEMAFHREAAATIVQDIFRAKALRGANQVNIPEVFFPVSVRGPANEVRTTFLKERLALEEDSVIILYFGAISESRLCHTIIEATDHLPENYVVVFHGYPVDDDYFGRLKQMANGRPVLFSDADLEEHEIDSLLASADIGLALYLNDNANDRYTAFSSQKIALFCRNGVPFIGNRNESYEELFRRYPCGEMASTSEEIAAAALKIFQAHNSYRANCFQAFSEVYDLDTQFPVLQEFIEAGEW